MKMIGKRMALKDLQAMLAAQGYYLALEGDPGNAQVAVEADEHGALEVFAWIEPRRAVGIGAVRDRNNLAVMIRRR